MITIHDNGETWYRNSMPLLKRARKWVAWIGGWERADGTWSIPRYMLTHPWPVSFFGHLVTFHGHWMQLRTPWGWLVVVMKRTDGGAITTEIERMYVSRDGTPQGAHCWIVGAPPDVLRAVAEWERRRGENLRSVG